MITKRSVLEKAEKVCSINTGLFLLVLKIYFLLRQSIKTKLNLDVCWLREYVISCSDTPEHAARIRGPKVKTSQILQRHFITNSLVFLDLLRVNVSSQFENLSRLKTLLLGTCKPGTVWNC